MERFQPVNNCDILLIAGEVSGDEHAGALVRQLKKKHPGLTIAALGGRHLHEAGAIMLEDLVSHSRVGLWEVFKHLSVFLKLIKETVTWIAVNNPRRVVFVDFVGYNLEIAKQLYNKKLSKKAGGNIELYYYVSPQIWAWKAQRRFKIAQWIDSLGTIFPFEPAYYKDTSLQVEFVGHPFVAEGFKNPLSYDPNGAIVLLPGSRKAVIKSHMPLLWQTYQLYALKQLAQGKDPGKVTAYYASEALRKQMIELTGGALPLCPAGAPLKASAIICTAGTIALTCGLSGVPTIMMYKTDPLTYFYGKSVYKKKYLAMPNLLLDRFFIKEFWTPPPTVDVLANALAEVRDNPEAGKLAQAGAQELRKLLSTPNKRNAVEWASAGLV